MADAAPRPGYLRLAALALVGVVVIAVAVSLSRCVNAPADTVRALGDTSERVAKVGEQIAEKFMTGHIDTTYREYLASASPTGILDVATVEQTEEFTKSDERRILWDQLSLGRTTTALKTTATFRYHVPLDREHWSAALREHTLYVVAPSLLPTLPTAFRSDQVEERSERGWARSNVADQMSELRQSVTPALDGRAGDCEHIAAAREPARRAIGQFAQRWLAREQQWGGQRFSAVAVRFSDEPDDCTAVVVEEKP